MKARLLLLFLIIATTAVGQVAEYGKITDKGKYTSYVSESGDTIHIGDTLIIGTSSSDLGFMYISQAGQRMHPSHAGKKVTVADMKVFGNKKNGYQLFLQFKGYGLPVNIDYDHALESGEIINPNAKLNKEQALSKLKEAKDMLDLELMTQSEYDALKNKLSPIIKGN